MNTRSLLHWTSALLFASAALSFTFADAAAQTAPKYEKVDLSKVGPKIGERVPDFDLPDQTGRRRTLGSVLGPKGGMLVFFRSADW